MAPREDRPYLPWYYKDWLTSPDRFSMTYEQRGIYRDLLDFAWDQRGLDTDKEVLRNMLGLDKRKFALIWPVVAKHFKERDGRLYNDKQERVRSDMDAYRAGKQAAGGKGGKRRAERLAESKQSGSTTTSTEASKQLAQVKPSFASSSSLSSSSTPPNGGVERATPLVLSPARYAKLQESHAFIGSRLRVPNVLHEELRNALGGDDPEGALQAWYVALNVELEETRGAIVDVFAWLRPRFKAWAGDRIMDAELERFRPKGA